MHWNNLDIVDKNVCYEIPKQQHLFGSIFEIFMVFVELFLWEWKYGKRNLVDLVVSYSHNERLCVCAE